MEKSGRAAVIARSTVAMTAAAVLFFECSAYAATSLNFELDLEMKSQYFLESQVLKYQLPTKEIQPSAYHVTIGHIDCVPDDKVKDVKDRVTLAMSHTLIGQQYTFTPGAVDVFNPAGRAKTIVLLPTPASANPLKGLNGILAEEVKKAGDELRISLNLNALTAPDGPNGGYRPHIAVNTASIAQHEALYASKISGIAKTVSKLFYPSGKARVSRFQYGDLPTLKLKPRVTVLSWKVPKDACPEQTGTGKVVDNACFSEEEVLSANSKTEVKDISDAIEPEKDEPRTETERVDPFEGGLSLDPGGDVSGCTSQEVETSQKEADRLAIKRMEILHTISPTSGAKLVGSAAVPGTHAFPADIDGFEKISFKTSNQAEASQKFSDLIQRMLSEAMASEDPPLYFEEMKAGVDTRFNEVNAMLEDRCNPEGIRALIKKGSLKKLRKKLDGLLKTRVITESERERYEERISAFTDVIKVKSKAVATRDRDSLQNLALDLFIKQISEKAIVACQQLAEEVRNRRVLRWNADEILAGFKSIPGIKPTLQNPGMTLDEALKHSTIVKLDVGAIVDGRLVEITNFFYASQLSSGSRGAQVMNQPMKDDYIGVLKKDVYHYAEEGNWMKAAKRRWRVADLMGDQEALRKLIPLFATHASALYQVASELETLGNLIKKKDLPPNEGPDGMDMVLEHILDKLEKCLPDDTYRERIGNLKPLFKEFIRDYRSNRASIRKNNHQDLTTVINHLTSELNGIGSIVKRIVAEDTLEYLRKNQIDLENMPEHDRHQPWTNES